MRRAQVAKLLRKRRRVREIGEQEDSVFVSRMVIAAGEQPAESAGSEEAVDRVPNREAEGYRRGRNEASSVDDPSQARERKSGQLKGNEDRRSVEGQVHDGE